MSQKSPSPTRRSTRGSGSAGPLGHLAEDSTDPRLVVHGHPTPTMTTLTTTTTTTTTTTATMAPATADPATLSISAVSSPALIDPEKPWKHPAELEYICRQDWPQDTMITYLCQNVFSVPPRNRNKHSPFVSILGRNNNVTYLPRGYRIPLMFVAKFQWESLRLVLTSAHPDSEWGEFKFDVVHLSRLCSHLLRDADAAVGGALPAPVDSPGDSASANGKGGKSDRIGGMDRTWRCPMFDRALTRFYRKWMICREWSVKLFWEEFNEDEYQLDVLKHDWARWVLKGHKGFLLTKEEVDGGITADQFLAGLDKVNGKWVWDNEKYVQSRSLAIVSGSRSMFPTFTSSPSPAIGVKQEAIDDNGALIFLPPPPPLTTSYYRSDSRNSSTKSKSAGVAAGIKRARAEETEKAAIPPQQQQQQQQPVPAAKKAKTSDSSVSRTASTTPPTRAFTQNPFSFISSSTPTVPLPHPSLPPKPVFPTTTSMPTPTGPAAPPPLLLPVNYRHGVDSFLSREPSTIPISPKTAPPSVFGLPALLSPPSLALLVATPPPSLSLSASSPPPISALETTTSASGVSPTAHCSSPAAAATARPDLMQEMSEVFGKQLDEAMKKVVEVVAGALKEHQQLIDTMLASRPPPPPPALSPETKKALEALEVVARQGEEDARRVGAVLDVVRGLDARVAEMGEAHRAREVRNAEEIREALRELRVWQEEREREVKEEEGRAERERQRAAGVVQSLVGDVVRGLGEVRERLGAVQGAVGAGVGKAQEEVRRLREVWEKGETERREEVLALAAAAAARKEERERERARHVKVDMGVQVDDGEGESVSARRLDAEETMVDVQSARPTSPDKARKVLDVMRNMGDILDLSPYADEFEDQRSASVRGKEVSLRRRTKSANGELWPAHSARSEESVLLLLMLDEFKLIKDQLRVNEKRWRDEVAALRLLHAAEMENLRSELREWEDEQMQVQVQGRARRAQEGEVARWREYEQPGRERRSWAGEDRVDDEVAELRRRLGYLEARIPQPHPYLQRAVSASASIPPPPLSAGGSMDGKRRERSSSIASSTNFDLPPIVNGNATPAGNITTRPEYVPRGGRDTPQRAYASLAPSRKPSLSGVMMSAETVEELEGTPLPVKTQRKVMRAAATAMGPPPD